jgi:hypothetical protein
MQALRPRRQQVQPEIFHAPGCTRGHRGDKGFSALNRHAGNMAIMPRTMILLSNLRQRKLG